MGVCNYPGLTVVRKCSRVLKPGSSLNVKILKPLLPLPRTLKECERVLVLAKIELETQFSEKRSAIHVVTPFFLSLLREHPER